MKILYSILAILFMLAAGLLGYRTLRSLEGKVTDKLKVSSIMNKVADLPVNVARSSKRFARRCFNTQRPIIVRPSETA